MIQNKFTDNIIEIDFQQSYSESDSRILREGIIANGMDDKWNIIFEQNTLSFYRSWTGIGIFKIEFFQNENVLIVEKAFCVEGFVKEQGKSYCSKLLNWVIEVVIFKRNFELPTI